MRIRYPISFVFAIMLAVLISALTVVWNLGHLLGLGFVIGGVFAIPSVARWEGK